jgi:hypothetical protein
VEEDRVQFFRGFDPPIVSSFTSERSFDSHKKSNKMRQSIKIFFIPYLYEAQQVLGDTPPIMKSLKLH